MSSCSGDSARLSEGRLIASVAEQRTIWWAAGQQLRRWHSDECGSDSVMRVTSAHGDDLRVGDWLRWPACDGQISLQHVLPVSGVCSVSAGHRRSQRQHQRRLSQHFCEGLSILGSPRPCTLTVTVGQKSEPTVRRPKTKVHRDTGSRLPGLTR